VGINRLYGEACWHWHHGEPAQLLRIGQAVVVELRDPQDRPGQAGLGHDLLGLEFRLRVVDGHGGAVALDQVAGFDIALCERDGEVAVDTRGSGREIGDALAEVFGLEGKTLTLMLLLLLLRPGLQ